MKPLSQLDLCSLRILDGGMATELERHGCNISGPLWSAHVLDASPDTVKQVHLDYLRAGADCISTASYQVSNLGYAEVGRSAADASHALRQSVEIAFAARNEYRKESDRPALIALSFGPYGAALHNGAEFHGRYDIAFDDLVRFHAERLVVAASTEADIVALETVPSLEEAQAILAALAQFPSIAAWVSFTCKDESRVAHGEPLAECAALLHTAPQVVAIGVNCTQPRFITSLIREIQSASDKPIFVYPNSGELWNPQSRTWYDSPHGPSNIDEYARQARAWNATGAQAVGGCCRTTPAHIRAIRENHPALVPK
jgi:homocysteine S-methyltransferase